MSNKKKVIQYLELLRNSGIEDFLVKKKTTEIIENKITLTEREKLVKNCLNCKLSKHRHQVVYGEGNPKSNLIIIGEGPGEKEDLSGKPFVGPAGELLTKILDAIKIDRSDIYITNIVKCRPPKNRNPEPEEVNACSPFLNEQIDLIKPKALLLLGKSACNALLKQDIPLYKYREKVWEYKNLPVFITYHPAALLRNSSYKVEAWKDLLNFKDSYQKL